MSNREVRVPKPFRPTMHMYSPGEPHYSDEETFNALTEAASVLCARDYRRVRDLIEEFVTPNVYKAIEGRTREQYAEPATSRRYSRDDIERWKREVDAVEVIGSRIKLTANTTGASGYCPFHDAESLWPSLQVWRFPDTGVWMYKCSKCAKTGNVFQFVADFDHLKFPDAVEIVLKQIGLMAA